MKMLPRNKILFTLLWLLLATPCRSQSADFAVRGPSSEIKGALVICGGGELPEEVFNRFVTLAGAAKARIVVIPTAAAAEPDEAQVLGPWRKRDLGSVVMLHTRARDRANEPAFLKPLTEASGVWLGGGDQTRLVETYRDTAVAAELKKLLARDGVIGGTSAGAAAMSRLMIAGEKPRARVALGLGLLDNVVIDQHFLKRNRVNRLLEVLAAHPGWAGLGIDEGTAVVVHTRTIDVIGKSYALACLSASSSRPASVRVLRAGNRADLIALSRAAIARAGPPFPAAKPPVPSVPRGTLIIGGGGAMPPSVWKRFIDAAGGPDAPMVVIPTANSDPVPKLPVEAKLLKKHGATDIKVLHTRSRKEADSPEFLAGLQNARGIWFTGGRQWRYVDAYLGTKAEKAFHDVLARGGVIGGSSAGASIQADYMARGDPLGNLNIIAEGYEQGLGFVKGVAIDQHFFKRNRLKDMSELMAVYPQLLGIGIDEGTAIIIRGEVMEVVGASKVAVYNRRRSVNSDQDYELLKPGTRYNLKLRTVAE
jgi:cyanophycinase